jgi:hypothetical protein
VERKKGKRKEPAAATKEKNREKKDWLHQGKKKKSITPAARRKRKKKAPLARAQTLGFPSLKRCIIFALEHPKESVPDGAFGCPTEVPEQGTCWSEFSFLFFFFLLRPLLSEVGVG